MKSLTHQWSIVSGHTDACREYIYTVVKSIMCRNKSVCNQCWVCKAIDNNDHHEVRSMYPSKTYYCLEDIEDIKQSVRFARNADTPFFIIINNIEKLSINCANSMLKLLEEPPAGYFFIGLTSSLHAVLPTLQSRAHILYLDQISHVQTPAWCLLFTEHFNPTQAIETLGVLERTEHLENIESLDTIVDYWASSDHPCAHDILSILMNVYDEGIALGSGKLIWKDIFLQMSSKYSG